VALSPDDAAALQQRFPGLTERQAEVFRIMLRGASNKEIARELDIGVNTVHTHVPGVLAAVGAQRRGEAVFRVVGSGQA
jgi:two-component system, NarL family, nitrate/nitrite response regulator NarL